MYRREEELERLLSYDELLRVLLGRVYVVFRREELELLPVPTLVSVVRVPTVLLEEL